MGACTSQEFGSTEDEIASVRAFEAELVSKSNKAHGLLNTKELSAFLDKHSSMWAMLAVNLNKSEIECKDIALQLAINLAHTEGAAEAEAGNGSTKDDTTRQSIDEETGLTLSQFHNFRTKYIKSPQGQLEFFQRAVFQVYDFDNNGTLDTNELDSFINVFYNEDSIFSGDSRLPDKKEDFKLLLQKRYDSNHDGVLSFEEIRSVISGKASFDKLTDAELLNPAPSSVNASASLAPAPAPAHTNTEADDTAVATAGTTAIARIVSPVRSDMLPGDDPVYTPLEASTSTSTAATTTTDTGTGTEVAAISIKASDSSNADLTNRGSHSGNMFDDVSSDDEEGEGIFRDSHHPPHSGKHEH